MNYDNKILEGMEVEKEHQKTYEWVKKCFEDNVLISSNAFFAHIAMDHIDEYKDYYTRLKKAGL